MEKQQRNYFFPQNTVNFSSHLNDGEVEKYRALIYVCSLSKGNWLGARTNFRAFMLLINFTMFTAKEQLVQAIIFLQISLSCLNMFSEFHCLNFYGLEENVYANVGDNVFLK